MESTRTRTTYRRATLVYGLVIQSAVAAVAAFDLADCWRLGLGWHHYPAPAFLAIVACELARRMVAERAGRLV